MQKEELHKEELHKEELRKTELYKAKLYNAIIASVMNNGEMANSVGETIDVTLVTEDKGATVRGKLLIEDITHTKGAGNGK